MTSKLSQGAKKGPSTKWALCICEQPQQNNTFTRSHAVLLSSATHLTLVSYAMLYTRYSHLLRERLMFALRQLVGLALLLGSCPLNHCSLASCRKADMVLRRGSRSLCTSLVADGAGLPHIPVTAGQTDRLPPFIWKIHRAYTIEEKEEEEDPGSCSTVFAKSQDHDITMTTAALQSGGWALKDSCSQRRGMTDKNQR